MDEALFYVDEAVATYRKPTKNRNAAMDIADQLSKLIGKLQELDRTVEDIHHYLASLGQKMEKAEDDAAKAARADESWE